MIGSRPNSTNSEHYLVQMVNTSSPTSTLSHESTSSTSSSSSPSLRMRSLDYEYSTRDLSEIATHVKSPSSNETKTMMICQTASPNNLLIIDRENLAQMHLLNRRKSNESSSTEGSISSTTFSNLLATQLAASTLSTNRMTTNDSGNLP